MSEHKSGLEDNPFRIHSSDLYCLDLCPAKVYYGRVLRLEPESEQGAAASRGIFLHDLLDKKLRGDGFPDRAPGLKLVKLMWEALIKAVTMDVLLRAEGEQQETYWWNEIEWAAKADVVSKDPPILIDYKTVTNFVRMDGKSSVKTPDDLRRDHQCLIYSRHYMDKFGVDELRVVYIYGQVSKADTRTVDFTMTRADLAAGEAGLLASAHKYLRIANGDDRPKKSKPMACNAYGSPCEYMRVCGSDRRGTDKRKELEGLHMSRIKELREKAMKAKEACPPDEPKASDETEECPNSPTHDIGTLYIDCFLSFPVPELSKLLRTVEDLQLDCGHYKYHKQAEYGCGSAFIQAHVGTWLSENPQEELLVDTRTDEGRDFLGYAATIAKRVVRGR